MTLSLISFSVQVLYGYLIIISSSGRPRFPLLSKDKSFILYASSCGWNFTIFLYYNFNHNFMYCFRRRKGKNSTKSLIYRLKSFFKCSFSWNSINLLSPFLCCVSACSLLLLRDAGERKILTIYWVNLCLPVQWLWIPFMLQYRCINYDYRKHQFFACFSLLAFHESDEKRRKNWTWKQRSFSGEGKREKNYKWFQFFSCSNAEKQRIKEKSKDNHEFSSFISSFLPAKIWDTEKTARKIYSKSICILFKQQIVYPLPCLILYSLFCFKFPLGIIININWSPL